MSGRIPSTSSSGNLSSSSGPMNGMNTSVTGGSFASGHPIQIIDITADHKFKLNEENLQTILNHPKAKTKKVRNFDFSLQKKFNKNLKYLIKTRFALFQWQVHSAKENHFC